PASREKLVVSEAYGGRNRGLKEKTAESRWFETTGQAPFGRAKAAYCKINRLACLPSPYFSKTYQKVATRRSPNFSSNILIHKTLLEKCLGEDGLKPRPGPNSRSRHRSRSHCTMSSVMATGISLLMRG